MQSLIAIAKSWLLKTNQLIDRQPRFGSILTHKQDNDNEIGFRSLSMESKYTDGGISKQLPVYRVHATLSIKTEFCNRSIEKSFIKSFNFASILQ